MVMVNCRQVLWCCGLWDGIGGCGKLCFRQKERHSLMAAFAMELGIT
jgi:hypothetical protein